MKSRKFKIKGREKSVIEITGREVKGLYLSNFKSENVIIGIVSKETKRGFYFKDMFFKEQFVNWNRLEEIELQEEKSSHTA